MSTELEQAIENTRAELEFLDEQYRIRLSELDSARSAVEAVQKKRLEMNEQLIRLLKAATEERHVQR